MNNKMLMVTAIVIIVIGAIIVLSSRQSNNTANTNPPAETQSLASPTVNPSPTSPETIIAETSAGFEPKTLTIKVGNKATWTNKSGSTVSINSDPHPTHTNYPPLNLGVVDDGGSVSLVFDKPGTYGYHDHFNPERKGTVVVE